MRIGRNSTIKIDSLKFIDGTVTIRIKTIPAQLSYRPLNEEQLGILDAKDILVVRRPQYFQTYLSKKKSADYKKLDG